MAAGLRNIKIRFVGDTKGLGKASADGEKQLGKFQKGLRNVNRVALGVAAGIGVAAVAWGKSTATALGEIEKLSAQTDSVIKSMRVKWTSTEQVEEFSAKLERLTGIEAEQIQTGQNLLLTFGNIQNKVGKGNAIFDRTTSVMNDMSVALGQDVKSSAVQLGKALNDPVKGVTALQRVGVSFTASQKKQIEALVESGDTLGAQKLVLAELEKQFGGSAKAFGETMPGKVAKFRNAIGEASENLLMSLMPALENVLAIGMRVSQWMIQNSGTVKVLGIAIIALAGFVFAANGAYKVWIAATRVATAVQWLLNAAMRANPIGIIITLIAALVAGIIWAWKNNETFRKIVTAVWKAIHAAIKAVVNWLVNTAWPFIKRVWDNIVAGVTRVKDRVVNDFNWIRSKIGAAISGIKGFLSGMWDGMVSGAKAAVNGAIRIINGAIGGINRMIGIVNKVPGVSIPNVPSIRPLAKGGIVTGPTLALLGEAGDEAVIPLDRVAEFGARGPQVIENHIHIGDEVVRVVRTEIRESHRGLRRAVMT